MIQGLPWLSAAFVAATAALVLVLVRARLPLTVRIVIAAAAGAVYIVHYSGLEALTGWPSRTAPEGEFDVLGTRVVEPDRASGEKGHIELWVHQRGERESRLFHLPYSADAHEQAARAGERIAEGRGQRGRYANGATGGGGRLSIDDKPPPQLPAKKSR